MLVFDTNILIYALDAGAGMHQACVNRLEQARRDAVPSYLTWSVCYEFLRVATHPRVLARPRRLEEAWEFLESLLDSPCISVLRPTERHTAALAAPKARSDARAGAPPPVSRSCVSVALGIFSRFPLSRE